MGAAAKSSAGRHGFAQADGPRDRCFGLVSPRRISAAEPFAEAPIRPSGAPANEAAYLPGRPGRGQARAEPGEDLARDQVLAGDV